MLRSIKLLVTWYKNNNYDITLVASMKNFRIPYGTCELNDEGHLRNLKEKPEFDFLVNTGLYVINPDIIKLIPKNKILLIILALLYTLFH